MSSDDFSEVEVDDDEDEDEDEDEGFSYDWRSIHFFDKFVFSLTIFSLVTIQSWTSLWER